MTKNKIKKIFICDDGRTLEYIEKIENGKVVVTLVESKIELRGKSAMRIIAKYAREQGYNEPI